MKSQILFVLACSFLLSCYEDKVGCLDRLASDYDVSADVPCEDCCNFPSLTLKFSHKLLNENVALRKEFKNDLNSSFSIISQRFYLSNISIEENDNQKIEFISKGPYVLLSGLEKEYLKDYVLVSNLASSAIVNKFKSNKPFSKINFTIGLDNKFNSIDILKATNYFDLDAISGMYESASKTYLTYTAQLAVGQGLKDTITVNIKPDLNRNLQIIGVQSKYGEDVEININLQYDKLFTGVNFLLDKSTIENKILSNLGDFIK